MVGRPEVSSPPSGNQPRQARPPRAMAICGLLGLGRGRRTAGPARRARPGGAGSTPWPRTRKNPSVPAGRVDGSSPACCSAPVAAPRRRRRPCADEGGDVDDGQLPHRPSLPGRARSSRRAVVAGLTGMRRSGPVASVPPWTPTPSPSSSRCWPSLAQLVGGGRRSSWPWGAGSRRPCARVKGSGRSPRWARRRSTLAAVGGRWSARSAASTCPRSPTSRRAGCAGTSASPCTRWWSCSAWRRSAGTPAPASPAPSSPASAPASRSGTCSSSATRTSSRARATRSTRARSSGSRSFGYLTIPGMALSGFALILVLLAVSPPRRPGRSTMTSPAKAVADRGPLIWIGARRGRRRARHRGDRRRPRAAATTTTSDEVGVATDHRGVGAPTSADRRARPPRCRLRRRRRRRPGRRRRPSPPSPASDFDGDDITIGADDGTAKVILFVAHWCPHCQAEVPRDQGAPRRQPDARRRRAAHGVHRRCSPGPRTTRRGVARGRGLDRPRCSPTPRTSVAGEAFGLSVVPVLRGRRRRRQGRRPDQRRALHRPVRRPRRAAQSGEAA